MARIRKGKDPGPVAVRRLAAKKRGPAAASGAANGKLRPMRRVIEFPKAAAADEAISERIIIDVGGDQFAIRWTAEIEHLPPTGTVAAKRKQGLNSDRSLQINALTDAIRE